jgi:hypothetical protein
MKNNDLDSSPAIIDMQRFVNEYLHIGKQKKRWSVLNLLVFLTILLLPFFLKWDLNITIPVAISYLFISEFVLDRVYDHQFSALIEKIEAKIQ